MERFQKLVLVSAIILLVIILIFIGYSLAKGRKESWPPIVPECPDYWLSDGSGNNGVCVNTRDLGVCPAQPGNRHLIMNFNTPAFTGTNGLCQKYKWANGCKVAWDGITYGVSNPCSA
jgi:hypothetical protein